MVGETPPGGDFVQPDGIRVRGNELEHAAGGLDAGGGGGTVEVFGFLRFVWDAVFDAAEAGPMHDDFCGVVKEAETHALPVELLVALALGEVEEGGEAGAPAFKFFVEGGHGGLDLRPGFQHGGGAVEHRHDVVGYGAEEGEFCKVEGEGWRDIFEEIERRIMRRCRRVGGTPRGLAIARGQAG